jgi:hypothetical protein
MPRGETKQANGQNPLSQYMSQPFSDRAHRMSLSAPDLAQRHFENPGKRKDR